MLKDELSNCTPLADEFLGWELVSNRSRWVDQTWRFHLEKKCGINGCSLAKPWERWIEARIMGYKGVF